MDLRVYYKTVREVESTLTEQFVVLVSLATPDGGKAGVFTEAGRHIAARQIAEGKARLATNDEASAFHHENARRRREREELDQVNRMQFVIAPQKPATKPAKD